MCMYREPSYDMKCFSEHLMKKGFSFSYFCVFFFPSPTELRLAFLEVARYIRLFEILLKCVPFLFFVKLHASVSAFLGPGFIQTKVTK